MNTNTPFSVKKYILVILLIVVSFTTFAQSNTTYKVVCDKTDNSIKIVESSNHSAKYLPLKAGFPFRQIAEKWITENHPSRSCDSGQKPLNPDTNDNIPTPDKSKTTTQTSSPNTVISNSTPSVNYRNSSIIFHGKFSNLGEAFYLSNENVSGIEFGFEQLFGTVGYFGTGLTANFFFANMDNWQGVDNETVYFFRIPVFGGYRIQKKHFVAMFEAGGAINTGFKSTENDLEAYRLPAKDVSANLLIRAKVGFPGILFELGYDTWLGDVFADNDFKMSAVRAGIRVSF